MKTHYFKLPLLKSDIKKIYVGDIVYLTGTLYTARDMAHKRLFELIKKKQKLPFELKNATIYYVGPSPAKENEIVGSFGPTTAARMDNYAPLLYDLGVNVTIGKGERSQKVIDSIKKNQAIYFLAIGGTGAYLSNTVKKIKIIAFPDLGPEAIRKVEVENFPCYAANDSFGNDVKLLWKT